MRCPDCGYKMVGGKCKFCDSMDIRGGQSYRGLDAKTEKRLSAFNNQSHIKYLSKTERDKALHTLEGIIKGIAIDGIINNLETTEVKDWYKAHKEKASLHPFSELLPLLDRAFEDNCLDVDEVQDILWLCSKLKTDSMYFDVITSDLQRLHGVLHGILSDNEITMEEIQGLRHWLNNSEHLLCSYPYDEIYALLASVLADRKLSADEQLALKAFFSNFVDNAASAIMNWDDISELKQQMSRQGICSVCPPLSIDNKHFCFTGASSRISRKGFASLVNALGGIYKDNVTQSTDYLIVGNEGNPCWAFSCYGRKVETAMNMRKKGYKLLIVHENDFWNFHQNYLSGIETLPSGRR